MPSLSQRARDGARHRFRAQLVPGSELSLAPDPWRGGHGAGGHSPCSHQQSWMTAFHQQRSDQLWLWAAENCEHHAADAQAVCCPGRGSGVLPTRTWHSAALGSAPWQVAKGTGCWLSTTKIAGVHMPSVHSNPNFQGGEEQAGS